MAEHRYRQVVAAAGSGPNAPARHRDQQPARPYAPPATFSITRNTPVALCNLGCSKNRIDGERILHTFRSAGFPVTDDFRKAGVIVVNTCAFIQEAQEEAIEAILDLAQLKISGRCTTLIVSGCFSERYREEISAEFPEVDLWTGVHDWQNLIAEATASGAPHRFKRELSLPFHTQYLKIAEGCSHGCTYCAIPLIRGVYTSRPLLEILQEAKWLEEQGTRELILVAQDCSSYGRDVKGSLVRLIEALLAATTIPWIRIMYLHPARIGHDLLRLFASESRLCPYFDIPLQHIADRILIAMNRHPLSVTVRELLYRIRESVPGAGLRTAFIIGFPGETDAHFKQLVRFIEEIRFDRLGVFPYSPEAGTKAFFLKPRPRHATVLRRCEEIMACQREISRELLEQKVGTTVDVIIDGRSDNPHFPLAGRSRVDAPEIDGRVFCAEAGCSAGSLVKARITASDDHDLFGLITT